MLLPCSQSRRSTAARWVGSVIVPTSPTCRSPAFTSACTGNGRFASCNASTPPTLPLPDTGVLLYVPLTVQPIAYGGIAGFAPFAVPASLAFDAEVAAAPPAPSLAPPAPPTPPA